MTGGQIKVQTRMTITIIIICYSAPASRSANLHSCVRPVLLFLRVSVRFLTATVVPFGFSRSSRPSRCSRFSRFLGFSFFSFFSFFLVFSRYSRSDFSRISSQLIFTVLASFCLLIEPSDLNIAIATIAHYHYLNASTSVD